MAIIQNDKRKKELERLYAKPSFKLEPGVSKQKTTHIQTENSFLLAYHPTLVKDALVSIATLTILIFIQFGLAHFLE